MPSTAPAVTISFLGLGNDLVGRPLIEARGSESTASGPVPGSDPQASVGAARGQSVNSLRPEPTRFPTDSPRLPEIILAEEPATALAQAGVIVIDVGRAIETVVGLRQWTIRQGGSVAAWAESWRNERPDFGSRGTRIAHSIPAHGPVQAGINSSPASPVRDDKWTDAPRQGAKLLSPPIVVLSVAAIAQACRHYVHWWKSRRRPGPGQVSKDPAPGSSLDNPIPLDRIIPWDRATATGRPPFRRSRAS